MQKKFIAKLTVAALLLQVSAIQAQPPPPGQGGGAGQPPQFQSVSTSDPQVMQAAKFAAQQMNAGTLSRVLSAQKQGMGDVNYVMNLEMVGTNGATQVYQVEVCIPQANIPWRVKSVQKVQ